MGAGRHLMAGDDIGDLWLLDEPRTAYDIFMTVPSPMLVLGAAGNCTFTDAPLNLHKLLCRTMVTDAVDLLQHSPLRWKCSMAIVAQSARNERCTRGRSILHLNQQAL
jgi:hypothetical protein